MSKSIIIIGMGSGLSMGIAEKFGKEGYVIGMISRNESKLSGFQFHLKSFGIVSFFATADVADEHQLIEAITSLKLNLININVLQYNAVDYRIKHIMDESVEDLANGFKISVANVLVAVKTLLPDLKENQGAVLLTGGGSAITPSPDMGSISLGKAGIRNLALQLHLILQKDKVYVGTLNISGWISPGSKTHSPQVLAGKFWEMYNERKEVEVIY